MEESEVKDNKKKTVINKLTNWYVDYRKLIIGILCALTTACWFTVNLGLTKGVLFIGKLRRPEYIDFYTKYRNNHLNTETNLIMTEFRIILLIAAIILLVCNVMAPARYESEKYSAFWGCLFNITLITLGFSMLTYSMLLICLYKIFSISSILYVLIGVFCFVLLLCTNKDFDAEHPDKYEFKIGSYLCGILCFILIVTIGFENIKNEIATVSEKKEAYHHKYQVQAWIDTGDCLEDNDDNLYVKLHFYNQYNTEGKSYDYEELLEAYQNYWDDDSSWKVYKDFSDDYFELYRDGMLDATSDYGNLVKQKLYYEGYCYGYDNNQPEIPKDVLAEACQEVDEIFLTEKAVEKYDKDIEITVNGALTVGENPSLEVSSSDNGDEYSAYIYNVVKVNNVGDYKQADYIEVYNYKSEEAFIIQDDSVYLLKLMIAPSLDNVFSEDINISVKGIDYKDIRIEEDDLFGYRGESFEERCVAYTVYLWVTTGD